MKRALLAAGGGQRPDQFFLDLFLDPLQPLLGAGGTLFVMLDRGLQLLDAILDEEIEFGQGNPAVVPIVGLALREGLDHRPREGAIADLEVAAIFAYIVLQPNTAVLQDRLSLERAGRIPTDGWMRSERVGVCAAGTVRSQSPCRAVGAAGDGASAAVAVDRYLTDGSWRDG